MIKENKASKYMLYATGEIALVVIGILIALSINNWNEQRKANIQEVKILKQLKADLINNFEEAKEIDKAVISRIRYSDSITLYLNEKRKVNDSLLMYFIGVRNHNFFNSANTAYKYIQSEGMNILSNDSLRAHVTTMYEKDFRNIDLRSAAEIKMVNNTIDPFFHKHFKPAVANIKGEGYVKALTKPINMETLYENFEFQNILLEHNAYLKIRNRWLKDTLKDLAKLIEDIQKEIERLEN
ncbi:hypothetical protein JYU05_01200 [bacterium AH-315-P13]|nr:hypothetical protein [bacterium AH-315-P13]